MDNIDDNNAMYNTIVENIVWEDEILTAIDGHFKQENATINAMLSNGRQSLGHS